MTTTSWTTFSVGGEIAVRRLGFGAMRITGPGIWGPPPQGEIGAISAAAASAR